MLSDRVYLSSAEARVEEIKSEIESFREVGVSGQRQAQVPFGRAQ